VRRLPSLRRNVIIVQVELINSLPEMTVGDFAARLEGWFKRNPTLANIAIRGEVSEWKPQANGNVYFSLKDERAVLHCFAFANRARSIAPVKDGDAVVAIGSVSVRTQRSEYQLLVNELRTSGIGTLYAQYVKLKESFRAEGLFERSRKRAIPPFPLRVALVSARGKGAEDFEKVMRERAPQVAVSVFETRVQGYQADVEIAEALDKASRAHVDAIVLARGGGSFEDLFPFNSELVVRAVVRSAHPVITGIAHSEDRHLADEVADLACDTPGLAAEYIANLWASGRSRLERLSSQLDREMRDIMVRSAQRSDASGTTLDECAKSIAGSSRRRLLELGARLDANSPAQRLARRSALASALGARLNAWPQFARERWARALDRAFETLRSVDPTAPLERGYAIVLKDGRALRRAQDARIGDAITARLGHGSLDARVEQVRPDE
jgi:exodeoxyribonuclease VII large subunit